MSISNVDASLLVDDTEREMALIDLKEILQSLNLYIQEMVENDSFRADITDLCLYHLSILLYAVERKHNIQNLTQILAYQLFKYDKLSLFRDWIKEHQTSQCQTLIQNLIVLSNVLTPIEINKKLTDITKYLAANEAVNLKQIRGDLAYLIAILPNDTAIDISNSVVQFAKEGILNQQVLTDFFPLAANATNLPLLTDVMCYVCQDDKNRRADFLASLDSSERLAVHNIIKKIRQDLISTGHFTAADLKEKMKLLTRIQIGDSIFAKQSNDKTDSNQVGAKLHFRPEHK